MGCNSSAGKLEVSCIPFDNIFLGVVGEVRADLSLLDFRDGVLLVAGYLSSVVVPHDLQHGYDVGFVKDPNLGR